METRKGERKMAWKQGKRSKFIFADLIFLIWVLGGGESSHEFHLISKAIYGDAFFWPKNILMP